VFKTGLAQVDDAAPLMGGHLVVVIGGSGSGKSTFTLQIARHHADTLGPTLLVSLELAGEEVAARIVSRECNVSWFAALRGVVSDGVMTRILDHDRIRIVDDFSVTPAHIRSHVLALQREFPGQLVLVVIDYVQILDAQGRDERERIKRAMEGLRTLAKELGVVFMLVSQSSRDGAKALRSGNAVGTEASATGAESSQIERAAYVTFSLGEMTESANLDGPVVVDLSIGKTRFGRGDLVVPLEYDGRRGSWAEAGNVVTATRHKVNRAEKKKGQDAALVAHATADLLLRSDGPMSIADLRQQLHVKNAVMSEAVKQLLAESPLRVTRVKGKKAGGWWPLWSVSKAIERGVDLVPTGGP
jgi:KaiC/GvpD/RAD55 family RecA-like ATPase